MKKRSIGFILFAIAGVNLISIPLTFIVFPPLYERMEIPATAWRSALIMMSVISIISISILVCAGIIVLIKFRKGEIISTKRDTGRETYNTLKAYGYSDEKIKRMLGTNEKN